MKRVAPAMALAGALLLSAQAPQPRLHGFAPQISGGEATIDAWSLLVEIDQEGVPSVSLQRRLHYPGEIAPCASPADLRDAHSAELPPPQPPRGTWVLSDAVVTSMNARGRAICARIFAVVLEAGHSSRQYPLGFVAHIPVSENVSAIRISGWRGMQERTYSIAELRRRFGH